MVKINSKTSKPTPVDNDILLLLDSEVLVGGNPTVKKFTYKNLVDSLSLITAPVLSVNGMIGDVVIPEGAIYTSGDNVEIKDTEDPDYDRIIHVNESNEICANTYELMKFLIPYMRYTYVVDEYDIPIVDEEGNFIVDIDFEEVRYWLYAILNVLNGGTVGQILIKNSGDDLDFSWSDIPIQLNYQSDWDETDSESDAYIANKPTVFPPETHGSSAHTESYEPANANIQSHISDSNIHVSADDKLSWSAKQDELIAGDNITIVGNVISSTANKPINTNSFSVPIEFPEDSDVPPEPSELYSHFNKKVRIRKFKHTSDDEVTFDWATPHDMDTTQPIQFRVKGIKSEANDGEGSESMSVKFTLSGYASMDETSSSQSFGTPQSVTKDIGWNTILQHTVFISDWSTNITIPNISNDTINQFYFSRDVSVANNYVHEVAVIEIEIKYTKR